MMDKGTKDMIHEALEGGGGITQAKGHDQKTHSGPHEFERPSWECLPLSYRYGGS